MLTFITTGHVTRFLLFVFFVVSVPVIAQDDFKSIDVYNFKDSNETGYSGYVSLGYGWDSEESSDYSVDLEIDLPSRLQFFLSTNLYYSELDSSTDESKNYLIGLFNDPEDFVVLGLEYDYYKELDLYVIDAFRLTTGFNLNDWTLKFIPQRRKISGQFTILNRTPVGTSTGYGGEIIYSGHENWNIGLSYNKFKYDGNALFNILLGLQPFRGSNLLARKRLLLSGIEDNSWAFSTNYFFNWGSIGFDWTRSVGVAESADIAFIYTLSLSTFITESLAAELDLGSLSVSSENDYLIFSSLSLTYFW